MYTYTYSYTYTYIHVYISDLLRTSKLTITLRDHSHDKYRTIFGIHTHTCMCTCLFIHTHTRTHTPYHTYAYTCMHLHMLIYIHTLSHTHRTRKFSSIVVRLHEITHTLYPATFGHSCIAVFRMCFVLGSCLGAGFIHTQMCINKHVRMHVNVHRYICESRCAEGYA